MSGSEFRINSHDREILRDLAQKQSDYAHSERMSKIVRDWKEHNNLRGSKPMIYLEINAYRDEVLYPFMRCEGSFARGIEEQLLYNIVNFEHFGDDKVVTDYFGMEWDTGITPFGLKPQKRFSEKEGTKKLGYHIEPVIQDFADLIPLLDKTVWSVDREKTRNKMDAANDAFGDLLPVRLEMNCLRASITNRLVHLMSMETLFYAMYDYPDEFHTMMGRLRDAFLAYFEWMQKENLILPTTECERLGQGSYCFTEELPSSGDHLGMGDVWGFMDSQETAPISPDMFAEFIFPYYRDIADRFGMLSYGCCEPVHPVWDNCISKLKKLRKVSVSAWCDEEFMGERLRGTNIIYHRKPSATFLSLGDSLDEDAIVEHIKKTARAASGCHLEIAQRDVGTIHSDFERARRYIELVRNTIETYWKP